jgi:hypothetical protein
MSEAETHLLETMKRSDMRPDDVAYAQRVEQKELTTRLNLLFGKDATAQKDETTAPYETVEEGMTTDTTDLGSD